MTVDKDNCDKYSIGDRIVYDDSIGTVKFIGRVAVCERYPKDLYPSSE